MKRFLFLLIIIAIPTVSAFAGDNRVAINDLVVNSNRPNLEFVGKGIAEMVAIELIKSKGVTLVDRKKRTELMEETEFALSDLADEDSQVELGRMLAADYMIFGDLIDMDQKLLISMKMVSVQTGEVVWADKLLENLTSFLDTIVRLKPASSKGTYLRSIFLSTTMGPGIKIDPAYVKTSLK